MNRNIYQFGAALASGIVFGFGLSLSRMLNPARVQGFLDVFGADIFFDDSQHNIDSARQHVTTGHVPHGVSNPV